MDKVNTNTRTNLMYLKCVRERNKNNDRVKQENIQEQQPNEGDAAHGE